MCIDPLSIATIASAGVSAMGSIAAGQAQSAAYKRQAAFADRQAVIEQQQGAYEAARVGDSAQRQLASMRGQFLSSGVAVSTGSPLAILEDSATEASLDEQAIRYGATLRSDNARFEATQARQNASAARTGSIIGAISPFVNAASSMSQNRRMATMIRNPYAMGA